MSTVNPQITDGVTMSMEQANKLMHDVSTTESNTSKLEEDVKALDQELQIIDKDLTISKKINTTLSDLDSALNEAVELLEVVSIIPEIGAEASELKNVLSTFKEPIDEALSVSNKVEKVVGPIRNGIEKVEPKVAQLDQLLLKLMNAENQFVATLGSAIHCINALPESSIKSGLESQLDNASSKVDPTVLKFDSIQVQILNAINDAQEEAENVKHLVMGLVSLQNQINAVMNVLNPLISQLNAVKSALSHTIRVPYGGYPKICHKWGVPYPCGWHTVYFSFSVEQIIRGGLSVIGPVMDLLNKAMRAVLNPILKALHLNIHLPSIPGLSILSDLSEELSSFSDKVLQPIENLVNQINVFEGAYNNIESFIQEVEKINKACTLQHK
ncbi:hypothetical protein SAMN04489761_2797 [Tenacibaculum sp. MAR_2009_124]|uniref:hypothetical protein n=1 Tax=Tenacibaculum sp. MAR_2009_124 TaxID=1250059 RepID=UPI00089C9734|nr:hypothetical protein [Tenacibaculum sp. MAR_2009_124]SEC36840.1 hypothetical protein SAMN04489761_2797 [Tenacibaculum sp. MAR_2009_124]